MCRPAAVIGPALVLALVGCGGKEPALYPVAGTVKFADGGPAVGCVVEFRSDAEATKGLNGRGEVGPGGAYRIATVVNGQERDGAAAGPHTVIVVGPPATSSGGPTVTVPPRYMDYGKSGLAFDVKPAPDNQYPITLDRK